MTITFNTPQIINGVPTSEHQTDSILTTSEISRTGIIYFLDLGDGVLVRIEDVKSIRG